MHKILFIILFSTLLFQCKKEETNSDAINIIGEYIDNPVFGISDFVCINSDFIYSIANKNKFTVKSYFDKKNILFNKNNKLEVPDFTKITFIESNMEYVKNLKKSKTEFYTISKPIISEDKNYALLEVGRFNHKNSIVFGAPEMPDLVHVFLYKKENGKWKRLELITQIRL